jgi:hypothetical protein
VIQNRRFIMGSVAAMALFFLDARWQCPTQAVGLYSIGFGSQTRLGWADNRDGIPRPSEKLGFGDDGDERYLDGWERNAMRITT